MPRKKIDTHPQGIQARRNRRMTKQWRDMLIDAPSDYSPQFLGAITDTKIRQHCQRLYRQLRRDADNGYGVTLLRDLMLRRIVWSVRILERLEQAINKADLEDLAGVEGAEERLVAYMRFYDFHVRTLARVINLVMDERPPMKAIEPPEHKKRDTVTITED